MRLGAVFSPLPDSHVAALLFLGSRHERFQLFFWRWFQFWKLPIGSDLCERKLSNLSCSALCIPSVPRRHHGSNYAGQWLPGLPTLLDRRMHW